MEQADGRRTCRRRSRIAGQLSRWAWTEAGLTSLHHADKGETEIAMAISSLVYMDRVVDWRFKKPWRQLNSRFAYQPESGGVNGAPSTADPAEGERMREQIVVALVVKTEVAISDRG